MVCTVINISGAMRLLSFAYTSNADCTERMSASISTFGA